MDPIDGPPSWIFDNIQTFFWVAAGIIALTFALVVGTLVYRGVRYAAATPMSAPGRVVGKRTEINGMRDSATTWYHVTVELDDGARRELRAGGKTYGLVAEGDRGLVTWRDDVLQRVERS